MRLRALSHFIHQILILGFVRQSIFTGHGNYRIGGIMPLWCISTWVWVVLRIMIQLCLTKTWTTWGIGNRIGWCLMCVGCMGCVVCVVCMVCMVSWHVWYVWGNPSINPSIHHPGSSPLIPSRRVGSAHPFICIQPSILPGMCEVCTYVFLSTNAPPNEPSPPTSQISTPLVELVLLASKPLSAPFSPLCFLSSSLRVFFSSFVGRIVSKQKSWVSRLFLWSLLRIRSQERKYLFVFGAGTPLHLTSPLLSSPLLDQMFYRYLLVGFWWGYWVLLHPYPETAYQNLFHFIPVQFANLLNMQFWSP